MPTVKHDIRFIFETTSPQFGGGVESFKARVVYLVEPEPAPYNPNDSGVRNPCAWDRGPLAPLADLAITAQRNVDNPDEEFYAWQVRYDRPNSVDLDDAERMVKLLRRVNARLARLEDRFGRPESLAAFCGRVADVLGATNANAWGTYHRELRPNGTHYHFTDVDGLRSRIARPRIDA